ncbi:hypothetical protein [Aureliella helgolandensis]|uniref:Uncharacterized protein n=1 Tax=Aureliella helgolandensis TaxID=2527968 RepID=A0A518G5N1_9BACT|nr:hypothetical protein [Aureliella helgolandensis]QDV23888.1 hypothetical protein Q31a_21980 [Aureliella helgolandensis]
MAYSTEPVFREFPPPCGLPKTLLSAPIPSESADPSKAVFQCPLLDYNADPAPPELLVCGPRTIIAPPIQRLGAAQNSHW